MIAARAGVCVLLCAAPLVAETVSIEITPQGPMQLSVTASEDSIAANLGAALAKSLGCAANGARELSHGTFRARCTGVLKRHGQLLEGQLRFAAFRQALVKASVDEISIDVAIACGPYVRLALPKSWDETCSNGTIHRSATIDPRELPGRPVRLAAGYRTTELAMIFAPLPVAVMLAVGLLAWLNRRAAYAVNMDVRALWFSYVRAWSLGLTAIFVLWEAWWLGITGSNGSHLDVWALYSLWNGKSVLGGRFGAVGVYAAAILYLTVLSTYWSPPAFSALFDSRSFITGLKTRLLPALRLISPIFWVLKAADALQQGRLGAAAVRLVSAAGAMLLVGMAMRTGRKKLTSRLENGELRSRLLALSHQCHASLSDGRIVPIRTGTIVEPLEAEDGRVAFSDYLLDTLEPAEVDTAVVRRWSLPLNQYPWIRDVLTFVVALIVGALLSVGTVILLNVPLAFLEGLLHRRLPMASVSLVVPFALLYAIPLYCIAELWMFRRSDRLAAAQLGDADLVARVGAKLAPTSLAPWKWSGPQTNLPAVPAAASPLTTTA
jgi:hypothetical protein